ncbi:MAG: RluA family pseudouridine synthase [Clostridia bacterium]|nr:RluA family pseudouridine synthase [Clostridia bacterium]
MPTFDLVCEEGGQRLDVFVASNMDNLSRSRAGELCADGSVKVNGLAKGKSFTLKAGDEVCVELPEPKSCEACPENIPLEIVYEDDALLVVNKPKGMVVHPAPGSETGTLVNALLWHCGDRLSGINGVLRPGIVHRIDKLTSGLLIVAKSDAAHAGLAAQIEKHSFSRKYEGVVFGRVIPEDGRVDRPVGRSHTDRKKMAIVPEGRNAVTHYKTLAQYSLDNAVYSHMSFTLETGRTHQIRVHMASLGHPIAGDDVYGSPKRDLGFFPWLEGQCLHAAHIGFVHPVSGEWLEFNSPRPEYFDRVLSKLGADTEK